VSRAEIGEAGAPGPILPDRSDSRLELSQGIGFLVGRVHRRLRAHWERSIADLGLSAPQAAALRAAQENPGVPMRALARALGTDPMNGRRLALALERMGLLEIRGSRSDVRAREVFTTPAGADLARRLTQRAKDQQRALVEGLGEERAAVLRTLLARLDFTLSDDRTRLSEKRQGESQASSDARPC